MQKRFLRILGIMLMIALFVPQIVFADDYDEKVDSPIKIGTPMIRGNGCPEGSYDFKIIDDEYMSFQFNDFIASTDENRHWASASCNMMVPIEVDKNWQVGFEQVKFYGEAFIPTGGKAKLHRSYCFDADDGPFLTSHLWQRNVLFNWERTDENGLTWSECGENVFAHANVGISAQRPIDGEDQAYIKLKKRDISLDWGFSWRPCKGSDNAESSGDFSDESE